MLLAVLSLGVAGILPLDVEPLLDVLVKGGGTGGFEDEVSLGMLRLGFGTGPGELCWKAGFIFGEGGLPLGSGLGRGLGATEGAVCLAAATGGEPSVLGVVGGVWDCIPDSANGFGFIGGVLSLGGVPSAGVGGASPGRDRGTYVYVCMGVGLGLVGTEFM